jgi:hypothetical protein
VSDYKLDPALEFASNEVKKMVDNRMVSVEQRMDTASMMQMHSVWREVQECLIEGSREVRKLREEIKALENRIGNASMLLADWDGYYNPKTKTGNVEELASLIEDAFRILQGKSWRDEEGNKQ